MRSSRLASRSLAVAASAGLLVGCAATPPTLEQPEGRNSSVATIDKRVLRSDLVVANLDPARPGCSAAVGVRGDVVWAGAAGMADLGAGVPVTTETRFDMASVAKQFTATAILMLQRDGALSLSDPVGTYIEGLPTWGRTVTLDQLMHHTSRIRDYWVALDDAGIGFTDPADQARTLDAIRTLRTLETGTLESGTEYFYSNSNYILLAEVVHRVSGQPLPVFLDERIFTPLGLDMELTPSLVAPDVALSYTDTLDLQPPGWTAYGAIGIYTTPSELVRWGDQYRAGDVIQEDFAVGASDEGTGELYAAGMDIEVDGDLNHNGRFGGHITTFTIAADRETTIAVMCNGHAEPRFPFADALWAIWDPKPAAGDAEADG